METSDFINKVKEQSRQNGQAIVNGDYAKADAAGQLSELECYSTEQFLDKLGFVRLVYHEVIGAEQISESVVDIYSRAVGECAKLVYCNFIDSENKCPGLAAVEYRVRYMAESAPYKPDPKGKIGANFNSVTILSNDRCTIRAKAASESVKEEPCNPGHIKTIP